jgi:hypothetical protein
MTSAKASIKALYILTQLKAVAREAAQILPNIPLTILQLSFSCVKGNLTVGTRGRGWEQAHD